MAYGDAFTFEEVTGFELADFAKRCKVERRLLEREALKMAKLAAAQAAVQAGAAEYLGSDRAFADQLRNCVVGQAQRLGKLANQAVSIRDEHL